MRSMESLEAVALGQTQGLLATMSMSVLNPLTAARERHNPCGGALLRPSLVAGLATSRPHSTHTHHTVQGPSSQGHSGSPWAPCLDGLHPTDISALPKGHLHSRGGGRIKQSVGWA